MRDLLGSDKKLVTQYERASEDEGLLGGANLLVTDPDLMCLQASRKDSWTLSMQNTYRGPQRFLN